MRREMLGTLAGLAVGLPFGALTMVLSYRYLKEPQNTMDWLALVFTGLTTGIFAFFVVWGHFQKEPGETRGKE